MPGLHEFHWISICLLKFGPSIYPILSHQSLVNFVWPGRGGKQLRGTKSKSNHQQRWPCKSDPCENVAKIYRISSKSKSDLCYVNSQKIKHAKNPANMWDCKVSVSIHLRKSGGFGFRWNPSAPGWWAKQESLACQRRRLKPPVSHIPPLASIRHVTWLVVEPPISKILVKLDHFPN